MISLILVYVFMGVGLLAYVTDLLRGWEMIFIAMFIIPMLLYAKSNKNIWGALMGVQIFQIILRFVLATAIALNVPGVETPITMDTVLIKQFCGISMIVSWFIWLACVYGTLIGTTKNVCRNSFSIVEISHSHAIVHATNLFNSTAVIVMINLVVATQAYAFNDNCANIIAFIIIVVAVSVAGYLSQINIIRKRKEEFIVAEKLAKETASEEETE